MTKITLGKHTYCAECDIYECEHVKQMTNDSGFDLDKTSWDEAKKFKSLVDYGLTSCGSDLYKAGFSKALDLVMEEIKEFEAYAYISDLEAIISKLRGEK